MKYEFRSWSEKSELLVVKICIVIHPPNQCYNYIPFRERFSTTKSFKLICTTMENYLMIKMSESGNRKLRWKISCTNNSSERTNQVRIYEKTHRSKSFQIIEISAILSRYLTIINLYKIYNFGSNFAAKHKVKVITLIPYLTALISSQHRKLYTHRLRAYKPCLY